MKKSVIRKIMLSILSGTVLVSSNIGFAGEVNLTAGNGDKGFVGSLVELQGGNNGWYFQIGDEPLVNSGAVRPLNSISSNILVFDGIDFYMNTAEIYGGIGGLDLELYGGKACGSGDANENTVVIKDSPVIGFAEDGSIYGGYSLNGDASTNTVNITNSIFYNGNKYIFGGYSGNKEANNNIVEIDNTLFVWNYSGDDKRIDVSGGYAPGENANGIANACGNRVEVNNSCFNWDVNNIFGAYASNDASDNIVTIRYSEFKEVNSIVGGNAIDGDAQNNIVVISNSKFKESYFAINAGSSISGNAIGNTITINGNTEFVEGASICAGSVGTGGGKAYNNIVNLIGISTDGLKDVNLYGGYKSGNQGEFGGDSTPNTLNLKDIDNGTKINQIGGFDVINFDGVKWENGESVLEVETLHTNNTVANVKNIISEKLPQTGEAMTLIKVVDNQNQTTTSEMKRYVLFNNDSNTDAGITYDIVNVVANNYLNAEGELSQASDNITLTITRYTGASDNTVVLGESRAAATAFANQGSELIETGLDALARDSDKDTKVYAAIYGNKSEYETGSHVNVNGWSGIVGVGKTTNDGLTIGAFFENGEGNYRTYKNISNESLRGDGEATYNGGGFLVRKDNANGSYLEASLRAGNLQNELLNAVRDGSSMAGYDIDTFYYGAHVGIGKIIPRGVEDDSIDIYGKFIYAHYDDEDMMLDGVDTHFGSVESERLRLGFRINDVQDKKLSMYYGAAWEYEFGGEAKTTVLGFEADTPSLEGSTVIGEVGMHYNANEKWSIDLNVRGYGGEREGFSGSVHANYNF